MTEVEERSDYERARRRALKKHKFRGDVIDYIAINALLIVIWAITGFGYFWPAWVMGIWGVFLLLSWWEIFYRHDLTEEDIQREMQRRG